jgi:hypothetical protein
MFPFFLSLSRRKELTGDLYVARSLRAQWPGIKYEFPFLKEIVVRRRSVDGQKQFIYIHALDSQPTAGALISL